MVDYVNMNINFYDKIRFLNSWFGGSYEPIFDGIYQKYMKTGLIDENAVKIIHKMFSGVITLIDRDPDKYMHIAYIRRFYNIFIS